MKDTTITLPKEEYDKLIEIKENFDKKSKKEKEAYCKYLEINNLFRKFDGVFEPINTYDIRYNVFKDINNNYILKDVYASTDYLENFSDFKLRGAEKELNKLKNHWLVKLFGL